MGGSLFDEERRGQQCERTHHGRGAAAKNRKSGEQECDSAEGEKEADDGGHTRVVAAETGPEMSDRGRKKQRIVGMRPGNERAESVPPMRAGAKQKPGVEIPDGEGVPSVSVGMGQRAQDGGVDRGTESDCGCGCEDAIKPKGAFQLLSYRMNGQDGGVSTQEVSGQEDDGKEHGED